MFLPLQTEPPQGEPAAEWPLANTALIGITIVISLVMMGANEGVITSLALMRGESHVSQLLSHAFLHNGWAHLLGNMIFLFAFGNALNMRLGNLRYVVLYVVTAGFAGLGWLILGKGVGAVGASGAAMGVIGAAVMLLPFARVSVAVWVLPFLLLPGLVFPPAMLLIAVAYWVYTLKGWDGGPLTHLLGRLAGFRCVPIATLWVALVLVVLDAWAVGSNDGVAHWAHICGFAAGVTIAFIVNACGEARGTSEAPTVIEWLGWTEPLPAPEPQAAFAPASVHGVLGGGPSARRTGESDFEAWLRTRPPSRRRSRERLPSGAY